MLIVDYLREHYPGCQLGVAGESMGGHVACLLAHYKHLSILCADRTFNRLTQVIPPSLLLSTLFKLCFTWDASTSDAYYAFQGYKLMLWDPRDTVIGYYGSCKEGVVRNYLKQERGYNC